MTQPVDTNDTEERRARNRRVELDDLGKDTQQGGENRLGGLIAVTRRARGDAT